VVKFLSIGAVAAEFGVTPQTIRDWEVKGLIRPVRFPGAGTRRRYTPEEIDRVKREIGLLPASEEKIAKSA